MNNIVQWFSFISPAVPRGVVQGAQIVSIALIGGGLLLVMALKRRNNRWALEWAKEARRSALGYGGMGLLLSWFSSQRVSVLGARVWYIILVSALLLRVYRLWRRYGHWQRQKLEEEKRMQQLKYKPGR